MANVLKGVEGAMRGYKPQVDWGGEEGPATIKVGGHNVQVGTSGWRKRCLFILLFSLLIISSINMILTLWLLRKISLNTEGAGNLHILVGGLELQGVSKLDHDVRISEIRGQPSKDFHINGYYNISMGILNENGNFSAGFIIDSKGMKIASNGFRVKNTKHSFIFESQNESCSIDSKFFTVAGNEGAVFKTSLETPQVRGFDVHEFRIESRTRSITSSAGNLLRTEARDGDVTVTSINDVTLASSKGKFRFESSTVFLPFLFTAQSSISSAGSTTPATDTQIPSPEFNLQNNLPLNTNDSSFSKEKKSSDAVRVYQVCACPSGRLFLADSESTCVPDEKTCK